MKGNRTTSKEFFAARVMLEEAIRRWYQTEVRTLERNTIGIVLEQIEEEIIHTNLGWTQHMPSWFMAARVG